MHYRKLLFLLLIVSSLGCSSLKKAEKVDCYRYHENGYQQKTTSFTELTIEGSVRSLMDIRYQCVYSALYTSKAMYDHFGKWTKMINVDEDVMQVWQDVDVLGDGMKVSVITFGYEEWGSVLAGIMIYDQEKDILLTNPEYRKSVAKFFSKAIKKNDKSKDAFYEDYWKAVNPEKWEIIKSNMKKKTNS